MQAARAEIMFPRKTRAQIPYHKIDRKFNLYSVYKISITADKYTQIYSPKSKK